MDLKIDKTRKNLHPMSHLLASFHSKLIPKKRKDLISSQTEQTETF